MRAALGFLGLVLLLPGAAACSLDVEPVPPVVPLAGSSLAEFTLTADCGPSIPGGEPPSVHLWVADKPRWATVVLTPGTFALNCASGQVEERGILTVAATPEAPAFAPHPVELGCAYEGGIAASNRTAKATVPVTAGFFSILEAQVPASVVAMAPGQDGSVGFDLLNRGNGPTRVVFRLVNATEGIAVQPPAPVTLDAGGHARVDVSVRVAPAPGIVSRVDAFDLDYAGAYASDPTIPGDEGNVAFVVHARRAPSPGPDAALALVAVALVAARLTRPSA